MRRPKSEKLTTEEHNSFKKLIDKADTKTQAAEDFGLSRQVMDWVYMRGSGSPETIQKIREKIINATV